MFSRITKKSWKPSIARLPERDWELFKKIVIETFASILNSTYIFSTCAISESTHPKDNLYMWSHYANGHRGVAIEFDTALLSLAAKTKFKMLTGHELPSEIVWDKISYTPMLPKFTCESIYEAAMCLIEKFDIQSLMSSKFYDVMLQSLSSKSIVWSVEGEWRLIYYNEKSNLKIHRIDLPNDAITALYLGCLVTDHWKNMFLSELKLKFPNAVVFVARKAKGEFALEFETL